MSPTPETSRNWMRPAVFAAWAVSLAGLLAGRGYTKYLRPGFGWLLVLGLFIAIGFAMAAITAKQKPEEDLSTTFRGLALLVPILYLILPIRTTLDNSAFMNRFVGAAQMSPGPAGDSSSPIPDAALAPAGEFTLGQIFFNPDRYRNQRVIFTGMLLRNEELKPFLGGRDTAVYRFLITCCAADARPLAIAVETDQTADPVNDQWVRVEGIFKIDQTDGRSVPWVAAATLTRMEAPEQPYLY